MCLHTQNAGIVFETVFIIKIANHEEGWRYDIRFQWYCRCKCESTLALLNVGGKTFCEKALN